MTNRKIRKVLGINTGHNGGCALCIDGKIVVATSEERLVRKKDSSGWLNALFYCLDYSKINLSEIDLIVFSSYKKRLPVNYDGGLSLFGFPKKKCVNVDHHLSHACSTFFTSPFNESIIFVYDGHGNGQDTESFYFGNDNKIIKLGGNPIADAQRGITKAYEIFTAYFGWSSHEAGKTMGLASYGRYKKYEKFPIFSKTKDGWFFNNFCNAGYLSERLIKFCEKNKINIPKKYSANHLKKYKNMAAWVQGEFERAVIGIVKKLYGITKVNNLCLAGGGALNGVCNYKILKTTEIGKLHIFPAANDSGQCVGNALYGYYIFGKNKRKIESIWSNDYKGKIYKNSEIEKYLKGRIGFKDDVVAKARKYKFKKYRLGQIPRIAAKLISEGNIIGWFQGGSELGPRALGHRSIICDPRRKEIKKILNDKVKHREEFRPFAASVLLENVRDYFDINVSSQFMLLISKVKSEKISEIPAVVHVDGTCRLQTLTSKDNDIYYQLVKRFYKLTGVPMILNTSFNITGEPIIETPSDAVRCFLQTKMDYLVIHNHVLYKV